MVVVTVVVIGVPVLGTVVTVETSSVPSLSISTGSVVKSEESSLTGDVVFVLFFVVVAVVAADSVFVSKSPYNSKATPLAL